MGLTIEARLADGVSGGADPTLNGGVGLNRRIEGK